MSIYPTNGYVFSGACAADDHKRQALDDWKYARQVLAWFDDRERHSRLMRSAIHEWKLFKAEKQRAIANGYQWNNQDRNALRDMRKRSSGHKKKAPRPMDVRDVPKNGRSKPDSTHRVGRSRTVQPVRKRESRSLPALETTA